MKNNERNIKIGALILVAIAVGGVVWFVSTKIQAPVQQSVIVPVQQAQPVPKNETANWATYTNSTYGFEIKYPDSFALDTDFPLGGRLWAIGPKSGTNLEGKDSLTIVIIQPEQKQSLQEFAQGVIRDSSNSSKSTNFKLSKQGNTTFSSREAYEITFQGGIVFGPNSDGIDFDEPMDAVFIPQGQYFIAVFIPQSIKEFSDIASTLTLFDISGNK